MDSIEDTRIILSGLWIALMLTYLLGDVLRIYAGDFTAGQIGNIKISQTMLFGIAIIMLIPIVMVFLSLTVSYPAIRWITIIAAIFLFIFNSIGILGYPGAYDKFLILVGLVLNVFSVWYAWTWV